MAVKPVLKRFDIYVYRDSDPSTPPVKMQVPAEARIEMFYQGATVTPGAPYHVTYGDLDDTAIEVWDIGSIQAEDIILVDADFDTELHIVSVEPENRLLWVRNFTPDTTVTVDPGVRLVPFTTRPLAYVDPTGVDETGAAPYIDTNEFTGRAGCYVRPLRFDYSITGYALARKVYPDAVGSYVMRT